MNAHDERFQLPPPPECRTCIELKTTITLGVERNACLQSKPMHSGCPWRRPVNPSIDTATTRESE